MVWGKAGNGTVSGTATIVTTSTMSDSNESLFCISHLMNQSGVASSSNVRLNNDSSGTDGSSGNYATRNNINGGNDSTQVHQTEHNNGYGGALERLQIDYISNVSGQEKLIITNGMGNDTSGQNNVYRYDLGGKWDQTEVVTKVENVSSGSGVWQDGTNLTVLSPDVGISALDTNLQDNTLFVEKDTAYRYWFTSGAFSSLSGLTAYYNFEQTTGTMTNQASAVGSTDQITADGTFESFGGSSPNRSATGKIGTYATFFDGNSSGSAGSRYNLSGAPLSGTGDWTVSWWEKGSVSGNTNTVIGTYPSSNWQITISSNVGFWTNAGSGSANTTWTPSGGGDNNWKHYVMTRTSGNLALWYNGSVQSITGGQALRNGSLSGNPSIGSDPASGSNREAHGGTLDDMSIWNRALTSAEIAILYNGGTGRAVSKSTWTRGYFPITRGVIAGGQISGGVTNIMDYITIATTGNAIDFGDLSGIKYSPASAYSLTRGLIAGGYTGSGYLNVIDYITILTAGNASDFGDLSQSTYSNAGVSNKTRGVFSNNGTGRGNTLEYVTIDTLGNTTDFGDLTRSTTSMAGNINSETRGVFSGGNDSGDTTSEVIDYITIDTTGNATDFGNLTQGRYGGAGLSSETRGVCMGGVSGGAVNTIDYITIETPSNATDFGNLTSTSSPVTGGLTNNTRGVTSGVGGITTTMDYITIATAGNATDFGDVTVAKNSSAGVSG